MNQAPPTSGVSANLLRIVQERPGIHFRALERAAGLNSTGQLRHHLDQLQRRRFLVEVQDGGFHRFFVAGEHDRHLRQRMARFSRPLPRRIAKLLLQREMSRTELRRALGCADSTLGYYLARMLKQGDLVKHAVKARIHYALADPNAVREVLDAQDKQRTATRPESRPVERSPDAAHAIPVAYPWLRG